MTDINDNPPFLNNVSLFLAATLKKFTSSFLTGQFYIEQTNPVVWRENQPAGEIIQLTADDHDTLTNGPPFTFQIDPNADPEIRALFSTTGERGKYFYPGCI